MAASWSPCLGIGSAYVGHAGLLLEGPGHAREPEFVEQVEGGLAKHGGQDSFPLRGVV